MNRFDISSTAKILIADDSILELKLLALYVKNAGYEVILAEDGADALAKYTQEQPDLVILDIVMPRMDGVEAAKKIRELQAENYTPIIFLTSLNSESHLTECVAAGGDDFITKPCNSMLLLAKINSLIRFQRLFQALVQQKKELVHYQAIYEEEQLVAANLNKNILHTDFVESSLLRYSLSPMALFNGDLLLTARAPGNRFLLLLGDFTGHGLSASVGAQPTAEIFYGMARKGFSAVDIIKEINRKLFRLLPVNMFLAATIVSLNTESKFIELITCGLPEHYLFNNVSGGIVNIKSKNLPLGILAGIEPVSSYFDIGEQDYLYLFTDGVIEAQNPNGQAFDTQGVIECLTVGTHSNFEAILRSLEQYSQNKKQQDDVSLVELHCDFASAKWKIKNKTVSSIKRVAMEWSNRLQFSVEMLSQLDPVPILFNLVIDIQRLQSQQEAVFCIISELFTNAVDYGLLGLDASLKNSREGLIQFFKQRDEGLQQTKSGSIEVFFEHRSSEHGGQLNILVKDSGQGFDVAAVLLAQQNAPRGISRVKGLCKTLTYLDSGREVRAVFEWNN